MPQKRYIVRLTAQERKEDLARLGDVLTRILELLVAR